MNNPLNDLKVASPCSADWNTMVGDARVRFCGQCRLNVYNLSALTNAAATELIQKNEGRLCVRFYKRADGTVMTQDCPVGFARIRHRWNVLKVALVSGLMGLYALVAYAKRNPRTRNEESRTLMGDVAVASNTPHRLGRIGTPRKNSEWLQGGAPVSLENIETPKTKQNGSETSVKHRS